MAVIRYGGRSRGHMRRYLPYAVYGAGQLARQAGRYVVSKAGDFIVKAMNKPRSKPVVKSSSKSSNLFRRFGLSSGVLSGKVSARKNARWVRGRGRRRRPRRIVKRLFKGVSYQTEAVSTCTGDKCVYLGHTTACPEEMLKCLCMAVVKNVMIEYGVTIQNFAQSRTGYLTNGDVFQFIYKPTPSLAPSALGTSLTVAVGHFTFWDVVNALFAVVRTSMISGINLGDANILTEFQFIPTGGRLCKVDLQDANVNLFVKSALKVQNRSVGTLGDDEIDVNNVPLYGKMYKGTGNGALQRSVEQVSFICGQDTASVINVDGSIFASFSEPPSPVEFTHVKYYNKAHFNPGQVKTSVLTFKSNVNITALWIKLFHYYNSNVGQEWFNLGVFSMFGLERVIAKLPAEVTPAINLTYEVDNKFFLTVSPAPQKFTIPYRVVS